MSKIQNASESWARHSFQEVESYIKENVGLSGAKAVDMGLPSGRLWADCNVGANSPEEAGLFFQWGDVEGFSKDSGRYCSGTRNGERDWSGDYARTHGSELGDSQNIPTDPYFDAARKYMGSPWRMPTTAEIQELFNSQYTTNAWVTNYKGSGMNGRLATSKANGNTLFFPAAGFFGAGFFGFGSYGSYWSSSFSDGEHAYYLDFNSGDFSPDGDVYNYYGCPVRAVQ